MTQGQAIYVLIGRTSDGWFACCMGSKATSYEIGPFDTTTQASAAASKEWCNVKQHHIISMERARTDTKNVKTVAVISHG